MSGDGGDPPQDVSLAVDAASRGLRLDHFLASRFPEFSRTRLQALVREGRVERNGKKPRPSEPLAEGDEIRLRFPPVAPPEDIAPKEMPLSVLFEDGDLLVLDKPAGAVVHPGAGTGDDTLVHGLLHHCKDLSGIGGEGRPGIVHRLDKETSGCLLVAKNDLAHRHLAAQFAARSVEKTYLAAVKGKPRRPYGTIDAPIGRHPVHRQKMAVHGRQGARPAVTLYRVLAESEDGSLLECKPQTGRTHQIRVHLKHIGHPILGDPVYGERGKWHRHLLHAWKISFTHPSDGRRMHFVSPVPQDFPLLPPA